MKLENKKEYYEHIIPVSIETESNGRYIVSYTDGETFGGHSIEVSDNLKGPTKAQITG